MSAASPVVVGVDGRPGSQGALRQAVAEARRRGATLVLAHVMPVAGGFGVRESGDLPDPGTAALTAAASTARELWPEIEIEVREQVGPTATALADAAVDAQLLVVGRDSRSIVDHLVAGDAAGGSAAQSSCPVLVVPSFWQPGHERGRIVLGVKAERDAGVSVDVAFALAASRGAALTVVTAWHLEDPYLDRIETRTHGPDRQAAGSRHLATLVAPSAARHPGVPVDLRVVHGDAVAALLAAGAEADLLVIARRRRGVAAHGRLGTVGHVVLRRSDIPVLVVPPSFSSVDTDTLVLEERGTPIK